MQARICCRQMNSGDTMEIRMLDCYGLPHDSLKEVFAPAFVDPSWVELGTPSLSHMPSISTKNSSGAFPSKGEQWAWGHGG